MARLLLSADGGFSDTVAIQEVAGLDKALQSDALNVIALRVYYQIRPHEIIDNGASRFHQLNDRIQQ